MVVVDNIREIFGCFAKCAAVNHSCVPLVMTQCNAGNNIINAISIEIERERDETKLYDANANPNNSPID